MATLPTADISSFTDEQFKAFQNAAALGSGVQVTDNGNTYVVDKNTGPRTITAASLAPTEPIKLPQPEPDKTDYMTGIAGTAAQIAEGMKTEPEDSSQTDLQKMLASITTQSSVDAYNAAGTSLGIDTAQADALAARRAKRAAQAELAGIQGQVQAVVDRATAENLKLEKNINVGSTGVGGAGALASSSFLNVRQQEVNRQAAITALPLQALALAAQAKVASLTGEEEYAQSTLKAAQDKLDTTFKLWSDDADRKQTLQLKMLDIVIAQGNKKEAARAEALKEITTRNQSDLKDARDFAQSQSVIAKDSGQMDIAAKFAQLTPPDPTSKTFATDLQAYNNDISKLQGQIVAKATAEQISQSTIANVNKQLTDAKGSDGYTDPNLYARLRSSSTLSGADFDNRFGYLVNPLSAARLGLTNAITSQGALSPVDYTKGLNYLLTNGATADDQAKFQTDRGFQAWVLGQAG
mgnify:FL=1